MDTPAPRRAALTIVYLTVFIDLLGFGIILPALPFYAEELGASGLLLGVLLTAYSGAQLVGVVILGSLSDRLGRRPIILMSLLGSALSLTLAGFAQSLLLLMAARALAGLFGGSISTAQAYIADVTAPGERARFMGFLGAAIGLGFVFGPALGAGLAPLGFGSAAFVAAGLAAANLVFALSRLKEPERRGDATAARPSWQGFRAALSTPGLTRLLASTFLTTFAFVAMETTLAYLGESRYGLDERGFGLILVYVGVILIVVQGGLIGPLNRRFGERALASVGAAVLGLSLILLPYSPTLPVLALSMGILALGRGLAVPALSAAISQQTPVQEQGGMLGLSQSMAAAARAVGPVVSGWLYDLGQAYPYVFAGALSVLAALLVVTVRLPEGAVSEA